MPSVGKALPHDSAVGHVTGGARYIDDLPRLAGELCLEFVGAPVSAGKLAAIDCAKARDLPEVVCVLTHEDLRGPNHFGPIFSDEPFLVDDEISYLGQPVAIVAAESSEAAKKGRDAVVVRCESSDPILTIEQAREEDSFLSPELNINTVEQEETRRNI